jgi:hypothetical protein
VLYAGSFAFGLKAQLPDHQTPSAGLLKPRKTFWLMSALSIAAASA